METPVEDGVPSLSVEPQEGADQTETEGNAARSDAHLTVGPTNEPADEPYNRVETAITAGVDRVLDAFERKLAYDASKQLQVDRLHAELQQHRADFANRVARPLVHAMIRLHDDIGKLLSALRGKHAEELSPERFFALMEGLQDDVEIVLGQNGVTAYREPDKIFDPRRQRALTRIATQDKGLAGKVAETIRPGFEQGSEILEKERIAIYELGPSSEGTTSTASDSPLASSSLPETEKQED
jgi:molecular chaperone GrpE (heat shock protein)